MATEAERARRYRARQRAGDRCVRLVVPQEVSDGLIMAGRITGHEAADPDTLGEALGRVIEEEASRVTQKFAGESGSA